MAFNQYCRISTIAHIKTTESRRCSVSTSKNTPFPKNVFFFIYEDFDLEFVLKNLAAASILIIQYQFVIFMRAQGRKREQEEEIKGERERVWAHFHFSHQNKFIRHGKSSHSFIFSFSFSLAPSLCLSSPELSIYLTRKFSTIKRFLSFDWLIYRTESNWDIFDAVICQSMRWMCARSCMCACVCVHKLCGKK